MGFGKGPLDLLQAEAQIIANQEPRPTAIEAQLAQHLELAIGEILIRYQHEALGTRRELDCHQARFRIICVELDPVDEILGLTGVAGCMAITIGDVKKQPLESG